MRNEIMTNTFALSLEQFKKDCRFKLNLSAEQTQNLYESLNPISEALRNYKNKVLAIRRNSMLSDEGKNVEADKARNEAFEAIISHAATVDRSEIIRDLQQRVNTKVVGARERARMGMGPDAAMLAQELRQSVLPRQLKDGENMRIPAGQTVARMVMRASEGYSADPSKSELIIGALSIGWPWAPNLPEGTLAQAEAVIAGQVASDMQAELQQAQGVQGLLNKVIQAAQQNIKEIG